MGMSRSVLARYSGKCGHAASAIFHSSVFSSPDASRAIIDRVVAPSCTSTIGWVTRLWLWGPGIRSGAHELRFRRPPLASYKTCYSWDVPDTITFRPDEDAQRALDALTADGTAVSTAVRSALIEAARARARRRLRSEAEELAADAGDRAEAAQVLRDMETLRAW
jgi:hypothetical protein